MSGRGALPSFESLETGDKAALARALAGLERDAYAPGALALLNRAWAAPRAQVLGFTGPPGVGKSTLLGVLIGEWRRERRTVGVIAVDPSSRRSGGALLGDRIRLPAEADDKGVFIRSMAARDRLGGLAPTTTAAAVLMRAVFDLVVIETVGVGQSETDIAAIADTVVFCVQPGSGDSLQYMKAGIVEIPHVVVVTKADMGEAAVRARADVEGALGLSAGEGDWQAPVLALSARRGEGTGALLEAIEARWQHLAAEGRLAAARRRQGEEWLADAVRERFGREGLARAGALTLGADDSPFARLAELLPGLAARS